MPAWTRADIPSQAGKVAVITGATSGLGLQAAEALAEAGAEVVMTGRNDAKGQTALAALKARLPKARLSYRALDLSSLQSVAEFARSMDRKRPLDLLILNAGVMALPTRQTTADGFEMQFGTNYLGHFALTAQLLECLQQAEAPRVVSLSSVAHRTAGIDFSDLQGERWYSAWKAYGQSKLAMLIFALELQRRSDEAGWGLGSIAAHPGWAQTNLFSAGPGGLVSMMSSLAAPIYGHSAAEGALPVLYAATSPQAQTGAYYGPGGLGELRGAPSRALVALQARSKTTAQRLWEVSAQLTGLTPGGTA